MTFDGNLPKPADPHDLRETQSVVGIDFVDLEQQGGLGVPRIDAGDWPALRPLVDNGRRLHKRHIEADMLLELGHGTRTPVGVDKASTIAALRLRHVPVHSSDEPSRGAAVKNGRFSGGRPQGS